MQKVESMKKDIGFYWKLFRSTFYLSAFTFGGGYVIIPLMRKKFVEQYHWLEEEEMLDFTAIAQASPGAMAVNAAILIGYRLAGVPGALITVFATVLPPLIVLSAVSLAYQAFRSNPVVNALMRGMQAGVAAVITDVVIAMGAAVGREKNLLSLILMVAVFAANYFFQVNVILLIVISGVLGLLYEKKMKKREGGGF